jgi:hypothetical protein
VNLVRKSILLKKNEVITMRKQIFGIFLSLLMVFTVFAVTTNASAAAASDPPTVEMTMSSHTVMVNEPFDITVVGSDDNGLDMIWWWGEETGIPELDVAHLHAGASATYAENTWTISIDTPGVYLFGANSRDIDYWTDLGYPHQASEGDGIDWETVTVIDSPTTDMINDEIQDIPDECFKNNPDNRKNTFENKLEAVQALIDAEDYAGAINKLENDIKDKIEKWITCPDAQVEIIAMIDALIAYLLTL